MRFFDLVEVFTVRQFIPEPGDEAFASIWGAPNRSLWCRGVEAYGPAAGIDKDHKVKLY